MEGIFRPTTTNDKAYFDVDLNKPKRQKLPSEKFQLELNKHEAEATKNGLPFARHAARDDFKGKVDGQIQAQLRMDGDVDPSKIEVPKVDWAKYSDLKNFEVAKETTVRDTELSKTHRATGS